VGISVKPGLAKRSTSIEALTGSVPLKHDVRRYLMDRNQRMEPLIATGSRSFLLREGKMVKSKRPENSSSARWLSKFLGLLWRGQRCPLCTSILFSEAEHQSLDGLLAMLALHPVRCTNCFRRYYCFAGS
jgi:hypothetical protein